MKIDDADVLDAVQKCPRHPTYYYKNVLRSKYGRGLDTPSVRRSLRRLERAGKVRAITSMYAVMLCWEEPAVTILSHVKEKQP